MIDLVGVRFGRLVVESDSGERSNGIKWRCLCDCGNRKNISGPDLRGGKTRSCGCMRMEKITKHGATPRSGMTLTYRTWRAMKARCAPTAPAHAYYYDRGIGVCARWSEYKAFLADMGHRPSPRHSIDRIDNDKGYEPGNCRWATKSEQERNKRPYRRGKPR